MLTSAESIEDLVEALEVRFLANRDAHLHFALLTDFPDAPAESLPGGRVAAALAHSADRRAESKNTADRAASVPDDSGAFRRHILSVSPPAPLECRGTDLDGLRAQARQARRPERVPARRPVRPASRSSSARRAVLVAGEIRDHARHGHAAAARCGAAVRRRDGAPAEPRPASTRRQAQPAAKSCHRGYGILQPRVSHQPARAPTARGTPACTGASRASTRTRAPCRTSTRTSSAKARSSARASTTSTRSSAP